MIPVIFSPFFFSWHCTFERKVLVFFLAPVCCIFLRLRIKGERSFHSSQHRFYILISGICFAFVWVRVLPVDLGMAIRRCFHGKSYYWVCFLICRNRLGASDRPAVSLLDKL